MPKLKYTNAERQVYLLLAYQHGVPTVSRTHGVPERTLRQWMEAYGGIAEIRRILDEKTADAYLSSQRKIYERVEELASLDTEMSKEQTWLTYRALVAAREARGNAGSQAAAIVQVNLNAGD